MSVQGTTSPVPCLEQGVCSTNPVPPFGEVISTQPINQESTTFTANMQPSETPQPIPVSIPESQSQPLLPSAPLKVTPTIPAGSAENPAVTQVPSNTSDQISPSAGVESTAPGQSVSPAGAIAGGVIGGLLLLSLVVLLGFYARRRKRQYRLAPSTEFMRDNVPLARSTSVLDSSSPPPFVPNPRYEHPFKEKMPV